MLKRLINLIISLCFYTLCWLWKCIKRLFGKEIPGSCVILLYHNMPPKHRNRFRKQMKMVLHFAQPISANNTKPLMKETHYIAITFDDGFKSVLENAVPELQSSKIPMTFFVPTGYFGRAPGWIHCANNLYHGEVVVDIDELKSINDDLISIGSHGVKHLPLSTLSEEDAEREIAESKYVLESIMEKPVELFAFPHGEYTTDLVNTALQKGYKRVFSILPKSAFSEPNEVITGRIDVSPEDWHIEFILKLLGAYRWLPTAFFIKRKIVNIYYILSTGGRNREVPKAELHKMSK